MSKAPLVALEGKLGKFGHPRTLKVAGTGHLTKTKGHYMLHAAITASEAARLEEAARKVPAEEEALPSFCDNFRPTGGRLRRFFA